MVARLTDDECESFVGLVVGLGAADAAAAARRARNFDPRNDAAMSDAAKRAFDDDVAALFQTSCRGYGTGVDFGEVVRGVLTLIRAHRIRISAVYATLIIAPPSADGRRPLPGYLFDGARPLLATHRRLAPDRAAQAAALLLPRPPAPPASASPSPGASRPSTTTRSAAHSSERGPSIYRRLRRIRLTYAGPPSHPGRRRRCEAEVVETAAEGGDRGRRTCEPWGRRTRAGSAGSWHRRRAV